MKKILAISLSLLMSASVALAGTSTIKPLLGDVMPWTLFGSDKF